MALTLYFKEFCVEKKKECFSAKQILGSGSQPKITTVTGVRTGEVWRQNRGVWAHKEKYESQDLEEEGHNLHVLFAVSSWESSKLILQIFKIYTYKLIIFIF